MIETLGITIDRHPKGRLRKLESQTIEKNSWTSDTSGVTKLRGKATQSAPPDR